MNENLLIINKSLVGSDLAKALASSFKIRESNNTLPNTVIFPKFRYAFLVVNLKDIKFSDGEIGIPPEISERLEKFDKVHPRNVVLLMSTLIDNREQKLIFEMQMRFLTTNLNFIAVHNFLEAINVMSTIVKSPTCESEVDNSNELLQGDQAAIEALQVMGITMQESGLLLVSFGNLSNVLTVNKEQLMNCGLDSKTAETILAFVGKDRIGYNL